MAFISSLATYSYPFFMPSASVPSKAAASPSGALVPIKKKDPFLRTLFSLCLEHSLCEGSGV